MTKNAEDLLRKIQALVDKAHGNTTDAEAQALLSKADELMVKYSIEDSMLLDPNRPDTARPVFDSVPEMRNIVILQDTSGADYVITWGLERMFRAVSEHLFIRVGSLSMNKAKVVGYPIDLNFLEMYFLKLKMHMFSNMLATVDPDKSWVECMARFKNMGYKWEEVHYKLRAHPDYPHADEYWERKFGVQFTSKMKKFCDENPEFPRNKSSNPRNWQIDYVDGYVRKVVERLREMRKDTVRDNPNLPDLIAGKKDRVTEAFYDEFPDLRPHPETCQCDQCHYKKCTNSDCTRTICQAQRRAKRMPARRTSYRKLNTDAYATGRRIGGTADLSDKGPIG